MLALLIGALLCRQCNAWNMAAFGGIGAGGDARPGGGGDAGDRMLALVGALMIGAGDAGMLLARLLEEQKQ